MSEYEPVRYIGDAVCNPDYNHGQLPPAVGVQNYQVLRANRTNPGLADDFGWTYNHAPMLAFWKGKFYLEYLSNPVHEHVAPAQSLLITSRDGRNWSKPVVVFPPYPIPGGIYEVGDWEYFPDGRTEVKNVLKRELPEGLTAVMHQRMGFYCSPGGRLLVLGFYGICPTTHSQPNDGRGIGRVVREIYEDGSFGPIYFIRINRHAGWHQENLFYPIFTASEDKGFVTACEQLLNDKLVTLQWWEEDRSPDGFYAVEGCKALSYYRLKDGTLIGLWKWARAAESHDDGQTWSQVVEVPSLVMEGGKVWGQQTSDGRYAISYTPQRQGRYPLVLIASDDGRMFDQMATVNVDVSRQRFIGNHKGGGMNYTRGIEAYDRLPANGELWLTYSMQKEDIWVSRVPVPVRTKVDLPVRDDFNDMETGGVVRNWNITSLKWASVQVKDFPSAQDKSLELTDRDPYDYAKAERVFPESVQASVEFRFMAKALENGELFVELADSKGHVAVQLHLDYEEGLKAVVSGLEEPLGNEKDQPREQLLSHMTNGEWSVIRIKADADLQEATLWIDEKPVIQGLPFLEKVQSMHRICFRTGREWRRSEPPLQQQVVDHENKTVRTTGKDLPHADRPVPAVYYYINYLRTE